MLMSLKRMDYSSSSSSSPSSPSSFNYQQNNNHGIMVEQGCYIPNDDVIVSDVEDDDDDDVSSVVSSDSDLFEEVNNKSSDSSSSPPASPTSDSSSLTADGALQDMSSLLQELPFKKGLSKHYDGKSQSFTSLAKAICLEDLAKPENPYNKRLKSCKSYGGLLESYRSNQAHRSAISSRLIAKKPSRVGSCSSLKRNGSFLGNRPPAIPHQHHSSNNQTPLFA